MYVRCSGEFLASLDASQRQSAGWSRSPNYERPWQAGPHKGESTAHAMEAKELDSLGDTSATEEERQNRKRRILKGPPEFRELPFK